MWKILILKKQLFLGVAETIVCLLFGVCCGIGIIHCLFIF